MGLQIAYKYKHTWYTNDCENVYTIFFVFLLCFGSSGDNLTGYDTA